MHALFHHQERLINVRSELITKRYALDEATTLSKAATNNVVAGYIFPPRLSKKVISADELIVGALEASFFDMVSQMWYIFSK